MQVKELQEIEMESINGGSISSSIINAITNVVQTIYELGEKSGSSIRRLITGEYCPIN